MACVSRPYCGSRKSGTPRRAIALPCHCRRSKRRLPEASHSLPASENGSRPSPSVASASFSNEKAASPFHRADSPWLAAACSSRHTLGRSPIDIIMDTTRDDLKFALITPSYAPDFERCKLLVESVERCLTDESRHYIVVDHRDVDLFRQLTSSKVCLLVVEELLPPWIYRVPTSKGWWMSHRTRPIRNWILQQLVKISVCDAIDENVLVFCDSDCAFVRPFDIKSRLVKDNRLALLKVDVQNEDVHVWTEASKRILGIEGKVVHPATYISNMIAWYKPNILKMRSWIEETNGTGWIQVLCQYGNFSEYMLYGVFVDHVLGLEAANHFLFDAELIKPSWSAPLHTEAQIRDFFDQVTESHIGVMIHSKDNIPVSAYSGRIRDFWP